MAIKGIFKGSLKKKISRIIASKKNKEDVLEELEELLILGDISVDIVARILGNLRKTSKFNFQRDDFILALKQELKGIFSALPGDEIKLSDEKNIFLLVGINGSGKTTTAAKLAYYYMARGKKVLFSAADTFRAAGGSQLFLWGEKLGVPVIGGDRGSDPGAVVYNSIQSLKSKDFDLLLVDTAGRVQTRENLMRELEKLNKIIRNFYPSQPSETFLIVDATMGQNTLDQARKFKQFSSISGIILAKLDGTAKGGTIVNILDDLKIPVKFAGIGESEKDLIEFSTDRFIDSFLGD